MEKKKVVLTVVFLLATVFTFTLCTVLILQIRQQNEGTVSGKEDSYTVEAFGMNRKNTHTFTLSAGDGISVSAAVKAGATGLSVVSSDGTVLYRSDAIESSEFFLTVEKDGEYLVTLTPDGFVGTLSLTVSRSR